MASERTEKIKQRNLEKAWQARKEIAVLRREIRSGITDWKPLILGHDERYEERIKNVRLSSLLPCIPGIGKNRTIDILIARELPAGQRLGGLTWAERKKLLEAIEIELGERKLASGD